MLEEWKDRSDRGGTVGSQWSMAYMSSQEGKSISRDRKAGAGTRSERWRRSLWWHWATNLLQSYTVFDGDLQYIGYDSSRRLGCLRGGFGGLDTGRS